MVSQPGKDWAVFSAHNGVEGCPVWSSRQRPEALPPVKTLPKACPSRPKRSPLETPHLCSGKARESDTVRQCDSRQVKNKSQTHKWRHCWQKAGRVVFPVHLNKGKWKAKAVHVLKKQRGKETWSVWKQIARKGSSGRHRSSSELFTLARAGWKSASLVKWVLSSVLCFYFFNSGSPHFPIWL